MWWAVLASELLALAACVASVLRRGKPRAAEHRSAGGTILALLVLAVLVDLLVAVGDCRVLGNPRAALAAVVPCVPPAPRSSLTTAVRLAEQALVMAWPAALVAAAWRVFDVGNVTGSAKCHGAPTMSRGAVVAWALAVAVLVLGRPYGHAGDSLEAQRARADVVAHLLLGFDLLAVAAGLAAVACAWTPDRRWARSAPHQAVLVLLTTELAVATIGPYVRDPYRDWSYAQVLYVVGFVGVAGVFASARLRGAGRRGAPP